MRDLIKNSGAELVSEDASIALAILLEELGLTIAKEAIEFASHSKRKTVQSRDIEIACQKILKENTPSYSKFLQRHQNRQLIDKYLEAKKKRSELELASKQDRTLEDTYLDTSKEVTELEEKIMTSDPSIKELISEKMDKSTTAERSILEYILSLLRAVVKSFQNQN